MAQKLKLAGVIGHVICNLNFAADDVGLCGFDLFLHVCRHEFFVVGIHRKTDAAFFQAQNRHTGREVFSSVKHGDVNPLEH